MGVSEMGFDWVKWVNHKIEKGEAVVRPVGYHIVAEPLRGFMSRLTLAGI